MMEEANIDQQMESSNDLDHLFDSSTTHNDEIDHEMHDTGHSDAAELADDVNNNFSGGKFLSSEGIEADHGGATKLADEVNDISNPSKITSSEDSDHFRDDGKFTYEIISLPMECMM